MKGATQGRFRKIKAAQRAKDFAELSAQAERLADPMEQAKAYLQRTGRIVSREQEPRSGWIIGGHREQSDAALVALAERLGWKPSERIKRECPRT